jgi:hypothetical protein
MMKKPALFLLAVFALPFTASASPDPVPEGYQSLFNGKDLSNWTIPEGDNGHWKVLDGVIDYDAQSEAEGDKNLWTVEEYGDFELRIDLAHQGNDRLLRRALRPPRRQHGKRSRREKPHPPDAERRLGHLSPRHVEVSAQHLVLADRVGRGLRDPQQ